SSSSTLPRSHQRRSAQYRNAATAARRRESQLAQLTCACFHNPMTLSLPVLDMRGFLSDPGSAAGRDFVLRLRDACHGLGFCYLVGHGVPEDADCAMLARAREFFGLPEHEREALAIARSPHFRGYTRLGDECTKGASDWREQLDVGPEEPA